VPPSHDRVVALSGGYYFGQLERLVRDLQPLFAVEGEDEVRIDLTRLVFIGPTAMALLLAAVNRVGLSCPVVIDAPHNPLTARYFWRSDFVKHFVETDEEESFDRKSPKGFRPCAHFTTDAECTSVARDMSNALLERVPKSDSIARAGITRPSSS